MKRISLFITFFFASLTGFAQEEVAIEQSISQQINKLEINPGWDVHLFHHEADSGYRVAIITSEDWAAFAYNVQLCNVKEQTLTILENTQLPQGTVVEIEGPMAFKQIHLLDRATAEADYVIASAQEKVTHLYLGMDATLHIQHYHIPDLDGSPGADVWDRAKLTMDTISGTGNAGITVYDHAEFHYGTNTLQGKITLVEYEASPEWHYQQKDYRKIKTKKVNGEWVTSDRSRTWNNALILDASMGLRKGDTPKDPDSPFLQYNTFSINIGMSTYFRLSPHWGLSTGFQWNQNRKSLCHQVNYEDNELKVVDGQGDFQRNKLVNDYVGIPVTLYYHLGKRQTESVSLDFYCGHLVGERLATTIDPTKFTGLAAWTSGTIENIFNPWKMEVGLSFNTQHLGFIHGVRVFTNLLPEYKPGVTDSKFRTVGVEFKL